MNPECMTLADHISAQKATKVGIRRLVFNKISMDEPINLLITDCRDQLSLSLSNAKVTIRHDFCDTTIDINVHDQHLFLVFHDEYVFIFTAVLNIELGLRADFENKLNYADPKFSIDKLVQISKEIIKRNQQACLIETCPILIHQP